MLRAREPKLLNADKAARMLDASTYEEAAKLLTDCGYEDMSQMNTSEVEQVLSGHRKEIFEEIKRLSPDRMIPELFQMKYDYHNAKVILKAEAMESASDHLLSDAGRISPAELKSLYHEEKFSSMPGHLGKAMEEASSLLARTANPQQADFVLDKAYYAEFTEAAKQSGNAFLQGYGKLLIDCANLKSTVRTMRMGKDRDFLKDALIPGGSIGTDRILAASDKEALAALFSCSELEKAAALGAEAIDGGTLTDFERSCDNALNTYLGKAKLVSFGSEPVTAYLAAVENEITAVRMILTGRLAGIRSDVIRERLRDLYA
jgi:V/A-type H+-transporting ATPase subunit C